jgi:hypothetical protein
LAKLPGVLEEHGEERLRPVLEAAVAHTRAGILTDVASPPVPPESITLPHGLADFIIEASKAPDYDHLLPASEGGHK